MTTTKKVLIATGVTLVLAIGGFVIYKTVTKKPEDETQPNGNSSGGSTPSVNRLQAIKSSKPIKRQVVALTEELRKNIANMQAV